jgi:hypothetical protein
MEQQSSHLHFEAELFCWTQLTGKWDELNFLLAPFNVKDCSAREHDS